MKTLRFIIICLLWILCTDILFPITGKAEPDSRMLKPGFTGTIKGGADFRLLETDTRIFGMPDGGSPYNVFISAGYRFPGTSQTTSFSISAIADGYFSSGQWGAKSRLFPVLGMEGAAVFRNGKKVKPFVSLNLGKVASKKAWNEDPQRTRHANPSYPGGSSTTYYVMREQYFNPQRFSMGVGTGVLVHLTGRLNLVGNIRYTYLPLRTVETTTSVSSDGSKKIHERYLPEAIPLNRLMFNIGICF